MLYFFAYLHKKYARLKFYSQHIYCIEESNTLNEELFSYLGDKKQTALKLKWCFTDAKEYGSIIKVGVNVAELQALKQRLEQVMETHSNNLLALSDIALLYQGLMPLINQAEVLARKYVAVVTNPPYMNRFDAKLSKYVKDYYEDYKLHLFGIFMLRNQSPNQRGKRRCVVLMV